MVDPHVVQAPPAETPSPGPDERRHARRGRLAALWNLVFRALRQLGVHAGKFYVTVGIFLVAGAVVAVAGTLAFAELGEHVREGNTLRFDVAILRWLGAHQTPLLTTAMVELTPLGTGLVVLTVVGVAAAFLWHTTHKHSARLLLAATAGSILLNNVLKLYFDRPRPDVFDWETHAASSSFPSGHAMSATVVYGTVGYLLARLQKHGWARALTLTITTLLILLICLTRLYLGVHYPSDVLAGIVIGLAWSGFCMATLEASLLLARRRAPESVAEEAPTPKEHSAPATSGAAAAAPAAAPAQVSSPTL
ncbi:MAG TPA: phosphatase PAP2 family protein [Gemmatimonadaceae bacterium]|nr:phosphatase PAP2 family protein [Gemmatimonadaceae bacterium]